MIQRTFFMVMIVGLATFHLSAQSTSLAALEQEVQRDSAQSWSSIINASRNAVVHVVSYLSKYPVYAPYQPPQPSGKVGGSGFFISSDGHLLTNFHVIDDAVKICIRIPSLGKEEFEVDLVGCCPQLDVALLKLSDKARKRMLDKLNVQELSYVSFGDSDAINESQKLMILGYPLNQDNLKSSIGICSGRTTGDFIQTTAPMNPGNSGGPCFDRCGSVIGICVSKIADVTTEGVAYLIPINTVKAILSSLYNSRIIRPPYWGLVAIPTTMHILASLDNPVDGGLYVAEVKKGSLAEEHGVLKGDVIYEIDGKKIDYDGYINVPWHKDKVCVGDYLSRLEIGAVVSCVFYRDGERYETSVTLEPSDKFSIDWYYPWYQEPLDFEVFGAMVIVPMTMNLLTLFDSSSVDDSFLAKYRDPENRLEPRIIISIIFPTSQFEHVKTLRDGDRVIQKVNGQYVKTLSDFRAAVKQAKGAEFLTIECEGGSFLAFPVTQLIEEELLLSRQYAYPLSSLVQELAQGPLEAQENQEEDEYQEEECL